MFGDFLNQLRAKGVDFRTSVSDRNEIQICCPFCIDRGYGPDEKYKLGLNVRTHLAQCFRCDWKSRHAVEAVSRRLKFTTTPGMSLITAEPEIEPFEMPSELFRLDQHWDETMWNREALFYLENRGVTMDTITSKHVLFTEVGKFAYRVVFPVIANKSVVGLVGRSIRKMQTPKYLNSTGVKAIWNIPHGSHKRIILCEGIFKALALESVVNDRNFHEKISVGALLGHSISDSQIEQLDGVEHVYIWPDPDPVGIRGAVKIASKLRNRFNVYLPNNIPTKQADEDHPDNLADGFNSGLRFDESVRCKYEFVAMKRNRRTHEHD